jgi:peptide/nickel transport system substrate-binding protein
MDRREFLARATSLGVASAAAYQAIGLAAPARAQDRLPRGGTLKVQMAVRGLKDTRLWETSEIANLCRGQLEYLVEYGNDGAFRGMLLEDWQINGDATQYLLKVRPGVRWSNGDAFTAEDVARNIARWCDQSVPGNSMATRMAVLIDPETGRLRETSLEIVDTHTLRLKLPISDISLVAGFADYPAAIVHASYDPDDTMNAVGTGPYRLTELEVGQRALLERRPGDWWGSAVYGGPYLDRIEYLDYGTDPASWVAAIEAGQVHMLHESVGDFIELLDAMELQRSEVVTMATVVVRPNQQAEVDGTRPYQDARVRRALALAVDNAVLLELGYGGRGLVAQNHHVGIKHPEYAPSPDPVYDPAAALALMREAGMADFEHELVSIDDDWRRTTADAVAALMRDAGLKVRRTVLPAARFWPGWLEYPFSTTSWNHRPLGVQTHALAYRSGAAWNEFGWSNEEFDALLARALSIADAGERSVVMARMERLIQDEGVTIQPYWRSIFRHARPGVLNAGQHITFEHHHYSWAMDPALTREADATALPGGR